VIKLQYALEGYPEPLTDAHKHILSWEGATERLYEAAGITKDEWKRWEDTGVLEADANAARFHAELGLKGNFVRTFFSDKPNAD